MKIRLGHSPDTDDAFMFYGLSSGKVSTGQYEIEHVLEGIQTLNDLASRGQLEITAFSAHAYAYIRDKYLITRCGGSFGDGYGPMIISAQALTADDLEFKTVAIPGTTTSAYLALQLYKPGLKTRLLPFDKITQAVHAGIVDCGLIIHEGQVTYEEMGLHCVVDLGKWWQAKHEGLPLPLGLNGIRKDLPKNVQLELSEILLQSIRYSLSHRSEALEYAKKFAANISDKLADKFVGMYVNDLTLDMGQRGKTAIETFLALGHQAKLIPNALPIEVI